MIALSKIPYLIEAIRNWAMDCHCTPQLIVEVGHPGVDIPSQVVRSSENGVVVLNVHDRAIDNFDMTDERIQFAARFSGQAYHVDIPIPAVLAVFSREQHDGVVFRTSRPVSETEKNPPKQSVSNKKQLEKKASKPHLHLVK